jgi:hypothetical protein
LKSDFTFTSHGTAAVDVVFLDSSDFSDVKVTRDE